jgi:hypothetical protein
MPARRRTPDPADHSASFFNTTTSLRVDLFFDFPIATRDLLSGATPTTIRSRVMHVASEPDLLRLKQIARSARTSAGDAEDIAFLQARRTRSS